ncbi:MAG TPA: hypothetical protein VKE96_12485 [Vicinamibacterales bacterium]|nr:hypothetical protein [Vicinamibacterales bacterium]
MTQMVSELYDALRAAGVQDDMAKAAARSVIAIEDKETLATKSDLLALKADLAELKADLTWRIVVAMSFQTATIAMIIAILLRVMGRP